MTLLALLRSSVSLTNRNGSSGTSLPRNLHSGPQPSVEDEQSLRRHGGLNLRIVRVVLRREPRLWIWLVRPITDELSEFQARF